MGRNQQQNGRKIEEMAEKYEGNKANPQRNNENCWGIDPLATKTMETRLRIRENSANIEVKCARVDGKKKKKPKKTKVLGAKKLWDSTKHEERTEYWNRAWKNKEEEKERKDRSNVGEEQKESWNDMLNLFAFLVSFGFHGIA
ncbi:hypothetical protein ACJW30_10G044600 [Castanea mollissima]